MFLVHVDMGVTPQNLMKDISFSESCINGTLIDSVKNPAFFTALTGCEKLLPHLVKLSAPFGYASQLTFVMEHRRMCMQIYDNSKKYERMLRLQQLLKHLS